MARAKMFGQSIIRGPPRPRPSIASDALSAVTDALTSIALYDDQQCVPRLLCEAAGGETLGSSGILQTLSGIQPLLTLLSAYNGISSNPLFVFGRAVFLGMSSNGNTASCRYAYPSCPTDPEQLIYYLNNHNGGFFRFFNSPQQGQQNVEQFYNKLTQNYGLHQQGQPQNGYGFYDPNLAQNYGFHKPNLYQGHGQQNYGLAFPYDNVNSARDVDVFKFPDSNQESMTGIQGYDRKIRGFTFPESNSNTHYNDYKGVTTVYVVRGNGDPRNPEIIKLRPGETIH
ncbi:uncharacterized protein LOC124539082 [Vanessa cardui]|uniref:uncharacterized protein LOC124539082 n=1 Tax=Vanessa cardui TaxID=171605 RepID=UPI001F1373A4|nr:uncharacterized protein LOC124539082 [Vanessa cardui]